MSNRYLYAMVKVAGALTDVGEKELRHIMHRVTSSDYGAAVAHSTGKPLTSDMSQVLTKDHIDDEAIKRTISWHGGPRDHAAMNRIMEQRYPGYAHAPGARYADLKRQTPAANTATATHAGGAPLAPPAATSSTHVQQPPATPKAQPQAPATPKAQPQAPATPKAQPQAPATPQAAAPGSSTPYSTASTSATHAHGAPLAPPSVPTNVRLQNTSPQQAATSALQTPRFTRKGAAKVAAGAGAAGVAGKMLYNAGRTAGHEAGHAAGLEAGKEAAKMTTAQKGMLVGGGVVGGIVAGRALSN